MLSGFGLGIRALAFDSRPVPDIAVGVLWLFS